MNVSEEILSKSDSNVTWYSDLDLEDSVHHPHWRNFPQLEQGVHVAFGIIGAMLFVLSLAGNVSVMFLFRRYVQLVRL